MGSLTTSEENKEDKVLILKNTYTSNLQKRNDRNIFLKKNLVDESEFVNLCWGHKLSPIRMLIIRFS